MSQKNIAKLPYLAQKALPLTCICRETLIHQGHSISEEEACQGRGGLETRGDSLIQSLWEIQTDAIINIIFGDDNADNYKYEPMDKLMDIWEK